MNMVILLRKNIHRIKNKRKKGKNRKDKVSKRKIIILLKNKN